MFNMSRAGSRPPQTVMSLSKKHTEKLSEFLEELLYFGTIKGFAHLSLAVRGKEELIVSIHHETQTNAHDSGPNFRNLPRNEHSLLLSSRTQRSLSGYGHIDVGLPPASPSELDRTAESDTSSTSFLIAAYAKYSCPYVWIRTNHDRIVKLSGSPSTSKDKPLRLQTTANWLEQDLHLWDILEELIAICIHPRPMNPFALDEAYLETLAGPSGIIRSGALLNFLHAIRLHNPSSAYSDSINEDHERVLQHHLKLLEKM
eukprot:TRINITY_DN10232_c0_g1_i2.p1 TRINITY_DN10232_c0_g1~~TRINITY_DN10232_c0_g1_i2.p1  ORF type:complete len:258 (+),score=20.19 TRINITY_DN10232_c0_g1_i2:513-1286(+)